MATVSQQQTPDPEALKRSLLSLSFSFVRVTETDGGEAYGLEPPLDSEESYMIPTAEYLRDNEHLDAGLLTPALSCSASGASSTQNSMPSTPLLTPTNSNAPLPTEDSKLQDYFPAQEHTTFGERIFAWGASHLQALETFVSYHNEDKEFQQKSCLPTPAIVEDNAQIEPAHPGAQVRFLIRPIPSKRCSASFPLSPFIAALTGGLLGFGEAEDFVGDEQYEFAAEELEL